MNAVSSSSGSFGVEDGFVASTSVVNNFATSTTAVSPTTVTWDESWRASILDVVSTYSCMSQYAAMNSFFKSSSNNQGIGAAYLKYGLPPKNRASIRHTFSWQDFCDWDKGMLKFYIAAQYLNEYQIPTSEQTNCDQMNTMKVALQNELVLSDKLYVSDNDQNSHMTRTAVLNDMLSDINSMYSNLSCDAYILQEQQAATDAVTAADLAASQQSQVATYQAVTATPASGSNVAIYAVAGVGVIITLMVIYKMASKKQN